jgi:hypothetical protein
MEVNMKNKSGENTGFSRHDPKQKRSDTSDQTDRNAYDNRRDSEDDIWETDSGYLMSTSEAIDFAEGTDGEE